MFWDLFYFLDVRISTHPLKVGFSMELTFFNAHKKALPERLDLGNS